MTPHPVTLTSRAEADLKRLPPGVQMVLRDVIDQELREVPRPDDPDEGQADNAAFLGLEYESLLWRRGLTQSTRAYLDAGGDPPADIEEACEYILIYALRAPRFLGLGRATLEVAKIISMSQLAAGYRRVCAQERRTFRSL